MIPDVILAEFKKLGATEASHVFTSNNNMALADNFYFWKDGKEIGYVSSVDLTKMVVWPKPKTWVKDNKATQKFYPLGSF